MANSRIMYAALLCFYAQANDQSIIEMPVKAEKHKKFPLFLGLVGAASSMREIGQLVKKALEFTDQCEITMKEVDRVSTEKEILDLRKQGFLGATFLEEFEDRIEWRAFLVESHKKVLSKGRKIYKRGPVLRGWAYAVADSIYEDYVGQPGFFSTKIAYGKKIPIKNGTHYTHIYIADYDGSNAEPLVQTPTVNIGPRWNKDKNRPLLFYSENTNKNMPMIATDMHKKKLIASNFDGLNMLPAFSCDGSAVIYCATRGSGNCQLYYWKNKQLKKITQNQGNNFSPVFSDDEKMIYFSSDFEDSHPQIYSFDVSNGAVERITNGGYCVSPAYYHSYDGKHRLGYSKMVQGIMQLFSYDFYTKEHSQLTFDNAQKEECFWSVCGTFLMCPVDNGNTSRIALYNTLTGKYQYLTASKDNCICPAWSGIYNQYPVILA